MGAHRELTFSTSTLTIVLPSNGTVLDSEKMDVTVKYGDTSFLGKIFNKVSSVELLLNSQVVAKYSPPCFLGFLCLTSTEQHKFTFDVKNRPDGVYTLQARGFHQFRLFSKGFTSSDITVVFDRTPDLVREFVSVTSIPPFQNEYQDTIEEHEGEQYRVTANLTIIEAGVISLSKAKHLIDYIKCYDNGTVTVKFLAYVDGSYLDSMFRNGTMMAVDGTTFGSCTVGRSDDSLEDLNFTDPFTDPSSNETQDAYLFIETAWLGEDKKEVVITGKAGSFLFMFDEAEIKTTKLNYTSRARELLEWDKFYGKKYPEKGNPLLTFQVGVRFKVLVNLDTDIKWSFKRGITMSVIVEHEFQILPELGLSLQKGKDSRKETYDSFVPSIPIYAIPKLSCLKLLSLPEPKLGIYFEVDYFLEYALDSNVKATVTASTGFTTGRKKVKYFVNGSWGGLSSGSETIINEKAMIISPSIKSSLPNDIAVSVAIFTGVQPGMWLYLFGLGRAGVFQQTGVDLDIRAASKGLAPISTNGFEVGNCDACHNLDIAADLVVENLSWELKLGFKIDVWWFPTIKAQVKTGGTFPGELRTDLFTLCDFERKDLIACSNVCCASGTKCVRGTCQAVDIANPPKPVTDYTLKNRRWNGNVSLADLDVSIENALEYPSKLFELYDSPDSPTCKNATKSSRTWATLVDVTNNTRTVLQTFCSFSPANSVPKVVTLSNVQDRAEYCPDIWLGNFDIESFQLELWDRKLDNIFVSNVMGFPKNCVI